MLAENLVGSPIPSGPGHSYSAQEQLSIQGKEGCQNDASQFDELNLGKKNMWFIFYSPVYLFVIIPINLAYFFFGLSLFMCFFSFLFFSFVAESKLSIMDNDKDYDVQSEEESVSLFSSLFLFCHATH